MASNVQTSYSDTAGQAYPGMQFDDAPARRSSSANADAAALLSGVFAARGSGANSAELTAQSLAAATDAIAGIILHSHARNNVAGQAGWEVGAEMPILENGAAYVVADQTMAVGDPVYARFAAGSASIIGAVRKDNDSGTAKLIKGARVVAGGAIPAIYFDKSIQETQDGQVEIPFSNGSISATTTAKFWKNRSDRQFLVDQVVYDNPTGLAANASNYFTLNIKNATKSGNPIPAKFSTLNTAEGALTADTYAAFTNDATLANRVLNPGDELQTNFVLTGTQTLPVGSGVVKGRFI